MASALPVVAGRRGGYTDELRNGENALLFESTQDAIERVTALRSDPGLAARLGHAAWRRATELNLRELPRRTIALLTDPGIESTREPAAASAPI